MKRKLYIIIYLICFVCSYSTVYAQQKQDKQRMDYELARQYISEEKYMEAISLLEDLVDKYFRDDYYKLLKNAYIQTQNAKKQEKLIKKAIKKSNNNFRYIIDLGTFYIDNNEKTKGEKQYDNVLKDMQANNSEIVQIANYFSQLRNYDYAVRTYLKGREIFKDETKYTYELTYFYQLLGKNEDIAKEYLILLNKNPNMLNQIEVNINNLFERDKDEKLYEIFSETVLDEVKKQPQKKEINLLYYWLLIQNNNYASAFIQAKAIDKRFNDSKAYQVNDFSIIAMNNLQYEYALQGFEHLLKQDKEFVANYNVLQNRLTCLYNQFTQKIHHTDKETSSLQKEYHQTLKLLGYNKESSGIMQQYANLLAYHLHQPEQAVELLDTIINMREVSNLIKADCKLTRADIYLINGDVWEASLTYSQVDKDFKNETIGSEAKFRNACLSYFTGNFAWAESQFDALRSSTTKLIANDAMEYSLLIKENMDEDSTYKGLTWFANADFCLYQNLIPQAEKYLDSIEIWYVSHPLFDEVLYKRAEIAIKQNDYHKADSLLQDIITKYPYDLKADDALMLLAQLNEEQFNDKNKAKEYYEKIILDYPSSLYIQQARKKYKEL